MRLRLMCILMALVLIGCVLQIRNHNITRIIINDAFADTLNDNIEAYLGRMKMETGKWSFERGREIIAVMNLYCEKNNVNGVEELIPDIIQRQLKTTGKYDFVPKEAMPPTNRSMSLAEMDFGPWTVLKVGYLIKGTIKKDSDGTIAMVGLYDARNKDTIMVKGYRFGKDMDVEDVGNNISNDILYAISRRSSEEKVIKSRIEKIEKDAADKVIRAQEETRKRRAEYIKSPQHSAERICNSMSMIQLAQKNIQHEHKIGLVAGVVDQSALYRWGQVLVYSEEELERQKKEYLQKTGSEMDLSRCNN